MFFQVLPWVLLTLVSLAFAAREIHRLRERQTEVVSDNVLEFHDVTEFVLSTLAESKLVEEKARNQKAA